MRVNAHIRYSHCQRCRCMELASLKPRKRPKQARSAVTVDAIVEAAARILEGEGFDGYTTNAIAQRAGVSIGSLYQYFPTKDAITRALIARQRNALLSDIRAAEAGATGRTALQRIVEIAVDHQLHRPALARFLDQVESHLPSDPDTRQIGTDVIAIFRRSLAAAGFAGSKSDDLAAGDLMAIIKGMVDAAGARGETSQAHLTLRVRRAVFGYLEWRVPGEPVI
jgi:AcrR family transcriptional regulator